MKKLLLGTAIAMVLATGSYAQTPANGSEFYTADGRFAAAHTNYDLVKNDRCRTPAVESAIYNLGNDITWMSHWILEMGVFINSIGLSDPNNAMMNRVRDMRDQVERQQKKAIFEKEQMQVWLENLNSKPDCPTPATPTSAIPGGNPVPTPPVQPPQVNNPQQPATPVDPAAGPCPTAVANVNDVIGLIRLHLTPGSVVEPTPAPYWQQETVDGNCTWYLAYYTKDADGGFGWNILHTNIPCTETPPGLSMRQAAGSDSRGSAPYCPTSTALNPPSGDETVIVPLPEDHRASDKPRDDNNQSTDDRRNVKPSDSKSDNKSDKTSDSKSDTKSDNKPDNKTSETRRTDSKVDSKTDQSQVKTNNTGDHANAKPAGTDGRANTKSDSNLEHTSRTVTNNKSEMSHVAHTTGADHMSGMHETGMHGGGMHHGGGFGGLGGHGLGGLGGGLGAVGLAGMLINSLGH